ncbi:hypothetical protein [Methylotenera sp.]|uniref:hypothetical protein n=1 Tax=Methylotenera sp. TaxID=2051956 RepID=UPI0025F3A39F|nr:hypothetical protein [Methylotenera sp.]
MRRLFFSLIACLLTALTAEAAVTDISKIYHEVPTLQAFDVCYGGGCAEVRRVALSQDEWKKVSAIFASLVDDSMLNPESERSRIARAIGFLETIIGTKIGTSSDRAGTFNNSKFPGQLDCNDEAINTTTYLRLMRHYGLVKLHEVEDTRTRNFFINGWPHSTAVIHEIASGNRFAVDSWFYDNGIPATIVPFEVWKSGYIPADSPILSR